jgi:site-specific DNA recombinase
MRAIIAARLSKLHANGQQGIGLDTQDGRSREYAEREGIDVVAVVADTKSGVVAPWDRKNLRPWVTLPEKMMQYDVIIAFKNDRLSRGVWADEARIRLWAEGHGKRLIIVDGPQWPPRHDGDKWAWEAQADQARKEWEAGRERSMRAQKELRERGKLVGRAPWGYAVAGQKYDKTVVPTDEGRAWIPQIFNQVIAGRTLDSIALWLVSEGVQTTSGVPWDPRTVATMIHNATYAGRKRDASGRVIMQCEALVPADIWQRANDVLADRPARRGKRDVSSGTKALLTSVLHCPKCGGPMYKKDSSGTFYYRCSGTGKVRRSTCVNSVRCDVADVLAVEAMTTLDEKIIRTEFVAGHNNDARLAEIEMDLSSLRRSDPDYHQKHGELDAEYERVSNLPATPDEWVQVESTETYSSRWSALDPAARGDYLREAGIRFYASKEPDMVAALVGRIAESAATGDQHRYSFVDRDGVYLAVWFGALAGL